MSGSRNFVILMGNLGSDPEVRTFQNGQKVCNVRVATSERWKDKQTGEKRERTEWHSVAIYQEGGVKFFKQHARKGTKVYIEGQLETRKWQDQSGQDRYTTEIVVRPYRGQVMILANWAGDDSGGANSGYSGGSDRGASPRDESTPAGYGGPDMDDEIPFGPEWRA